MTFDWWTLGLQAINFLVLVWLLHRVLYKPVLAVIEKRRELTDRTLEDARKAESAAEAERSEYEATKAGLEAERKAMLEQAHATVEADRERMLADARAEAKKLVDEGRATVAADRAAALAEMRGEVAGLGTDVARTLLKSVGNEIPPDPFLKRLEAEMAAMPEEDRQTLAGAGDTLVVATARALDKAQRAAWSGRLANLLAEGVRIDFTADLGLIAGAELRFPHAVINDSFSGRIEKARKALADHDGPA